jgi:hypothetical protein
VADNEVSYEVVPGAEITPRTDAKTQAIRNTVENNLLRKDITAEELAKRGVPQPVPPGSEIPKDLPQMMFKIGGRVIACEKMALDDEEARVYAKHLTILTGGINSKAFSALIILVITGGKIMECFGAIKKWIEKMYPKKEEIKTDGKPPSKIQESPGDPQRDSAGNILPELLK